MMAIAVKGIEQQLDMQYGAEKKDYSNMDFDDIQEGLNHRLHVLAAKYHMARVELKKKGEELNFLDKDIHDHAYIIEFKNICGFASIAEYNYNRKRSTADPLFKPIK